MLLPREVLIKHILIGGSQASDLHYVGDPFDRVIVEYRIPYGWGHVVMGSWGHRAMGPYATIPAIPGRPVMGNCGQDISLHCGRQPVSVGAGSGRLPPAIQYCPPVFSQARPKACAPIYLWYSTFIPFLLQVQSDGGRILYFSQRNARHSLFLQPLDIYNLWWEPLTAEVTAQPRYGAGHEW